MNATSHEVSAENAANPYPHGRWTPRTTRLNDSLGEVSLKTLFWNISESGMVQEAAQRLELLLESAELVPPFLTGMDCPMEEAV